MRAGRYSYPYPHPAVTVDCVVFGFDSGDLELLLIRRHAPPFQGEWALPGGFVRLDESVEAAARRELSEETGLPPLYLEQLFTFGEVNRDPRERVISVAYYALLKLSDHQVQAGTDAEAVGWFPVTRLPPLAFDHQQIAAQGLRRLKAKVRYEPIGFELLPKKFSLGELQQLYETVLGQSLDKRNFRKKILAMDLLEPLNEYQRDVAHRAAQFYRFNRRRYEQLRKGGFNFEI